MEVFVVTVYYPYENNYIVGIFDSAMKADMKVAGMVDDLAKQYFEDYGNDKSYEQIVESFGDSEFMSYNVAGTIVTRKRVTVQ